MNEDWQQSHGAGNVLYYPRKLINLSKSFVSNCTVEKERRSISVNTHSTIDPDCGLIGRLHSSRGFKRLEDVFTMAVILSLNTHFEGGNIMRGVIGGCYFVIELIMVAKPSLTLLYKC